jgi:hypothetical protein
MPAKKTVKAAEKETEVKVEKKPAAKKTTTATKAAPAKKAATTKTAAKKAVKVEAEKAVETKEVKKPAAKKAAPAKKATAEKKTAAKKPAAKKTTAKKTTVKKVAKPEVVKKTVKDYEDVINWKKGEAHAMDWLYIEINANDLLTEVEAGVDNLATTCEAILNCMLEGDGFIVEPAEENKVSDTLTVRYYCDNLSEDRRKYFDVL